MFLTLSRLDLRTIALAGQIFFNDTVVEETGGPSQQCNRYTVNDWNTLDSSYLWHTHSACCFSKYILSGSWDCLGTHMNFSQFNCQRDKDDANVTLNVHNIRQLQPGDSLFVQLNRLEYFVEAVLPLIQVPFVLFSSAVAEQLLFNTCQ